MSNAKRKAAARAPVPAHLLDPDFLARYFNHLGKVDADSIRMHCQDVNGEQWKREWEERKTKAAV